MELDTIGLMLTVLETHDLLFRRNSGDLQLGRNGIIDDQGVVTHCFEWRGNAFEDSLSIVRNLGSLAVHQALGPVHFAAEDRAETLVTETNPKHGDFSSKVFDGICRNAII